MNQHDLSVWCPFCSRSRLQGGTAELEAGQIELLVTCPRCLPTAEAPIVHVRIPSSVESVEVLMMRALSNTGFWQKLKTEGGQCPKCKANLKFWFDKFDDLLRPGITDRRIGWRCPECGTGVDFALSGYCLGLREVQDFWNRHPRLQVLGTRETSFEDKHACATSIQAGEATLTIYLNWDTLDLLGVEQASVS